MENQPVYISLEFTPNPNTLKYSVNRELIPSGAVNMTSRQEAEEKSELGETLFAIEGIEGVMIGRDFVTITKSETGDWDLVHKNASQSLEAFLTQEDKQVIKPGALGTTEGQMDETAIKIRSFLENEIRPAVAMDGGDISFEKYDQGTVYVHLQGSCSGCPSATATLKQGIEARLKQLIPGVKEVVAVD